MTYSWPVEIWPRTEQIVFVYPISIIYYYEVASFVLLLIFFLLKSDSYCLMLCVTNTTKTLLYEYTSV